jgi:hypothetical protein
MTAIMGTTSTGDRALDDRVDQLCDVLDDGRMPYDELTYKALAQVADEMQRFQGYEKFTTVETEQK